MEFDWSRYAIGGATRPDGISGLRPEMQTGLQGFLQAAERELGGTLQVYSGYRSPELQQQLWDEAAAKYPDPAERRKWVAPAGNSQHNKGAAADLKFNGVRIDQASPEVQQWIRDNAAAYGLSVPMEWEPWQVELAGARGGQPSQGPSQPPQGQPQGQFTDLRPQAPGNALASQQPPQNAMPQAPRMNALDPAAFQRAIPQRNALLGFGPGQSPYT